MFCFDVDSLFWMDLKNILSSNSYKNSIDLSSCKIKRKKKEKEDGKVYKFSLYTKTDIRCPRTTGPACAEVSLITRT
jgi:hypothetical protein